MGASPNWKVLLLDTSRSQEVAISRTVAEAGTRKPVAPGASSTTLVSGEGRE